MLVRLQWSVSLPWGEHTRERTVDVADDTPDEEIQEIAEAAYRQDIQPLITFSKEP